METKKVIRKVLIGIVLFGCLILAHSLNKVYPDLPTIQKMQNAIYSHPYGEAVTLVNFYPKETTVHLWIEAPLTKPTDSNCKAFAQIIWSLMMLDNRLIVYVDGIFVPSRQNPINYTWAKKLMEAGVY